MQVYIGITHPLHPFIQHQSAHKEPGVKLDYRHLERRLCSCQRSCRIHIFFSFFFATPVPGTHQFFTLLKLDSMVFELRHINEKKEEKKEAELLCIRRQKKNSFELTRKV